MGIWLHENGPKGGDEINLLKPGLNYGWPKTTFGVDYLGELVSKLQKAPGITDPGSHSILGKNFRSGPGTFLWARLRRNRFAG
jgi:hypothetical protein